MTFIGIGRAFAVLISVTTFAFLFVNDSWRGDNLFLVPDLVLCVLLLVAAALPAPYAAPAMGFTLAMCTGVFTASVSSYAVRGELGAASLLGVVGCAAMAALLQWRLVRRDARVASRDREATRGTV